MKKRIRRGLVWDKNLFCFFAVIALFSVYLLITPLSAGAYTPPIGIPDPGVNWGSVHPIDASAPSTATACPSWPSAQNAGCYYVDNSCTSCCSDSGNGYPNNPRCSIPTTLLPAGAYVEIHGGPYTQPTTTYAAVIMIKAQGTANNPIWIRGVENSKPTIGRTIQVFGQYVIFENFIFSMQNAPDPGKDATWDYTSLKFASDYYGTGDYYGTVDHVCVRNSIFKGDGRDLGNGLAAVFAYAYDDNPNGGEYWSHDIIVYNNEIFNLGNNNDTQENDFYGVKPTRKSYNIWVLDNHIYNMGGDAVQIGDSSLVDPATDRDPCTTIDIRPHHIFVGRNTFYGNREEGVDVKQARDVIISQNTIYNNQGSGIVLHYENNHVWVINNEIHSEPTGIAAGGGNSYYCQYCCGSGCSPTPFTDYYCGSVTNAYFIGNVIYDTHYTTNGSTKWEDYMWPTNNGGAAISVFDAGTVWVLSNTLYDYDIGIRRPSDITTAKPVCDDNGNCYNGFSHDPRGPMHLINNIFSSKNNPNDPDFDILYHSFSSKPNENLYQISKSSIMDYNLFDLTDGSQGKILWQDPNSADGVLNFTDFINTYSNNPNYLVGKKNKQGYANFSNPQAGDFHLLSTSAALDAGPKETDSNPARIKFDKVYNDFSTNYYGLNIARDIEGNVRPWPSGGSWDIGAYEYYTSDQPCRILNKNSYSTLQACYAAAATNDTIQAFDLYLNQDLLANRSIAVTLVGGYSNDFTYDLGITHLKGKLQITNGSLTIKNFQLDQ